jgi:superfamily II DNA or RNA helicase
MAENEYYPYPSDPNFQSKIYKKREFQYNRSSQRKKITNYNELEKYRDDVCNKKLTANPHQSFLSSYITPKTPYRGVLIFHGVGTGKTLSAIGIAESFKQEIRRFQTKIYVLVSGPLIRDNWKNDIIKFYAKDYFKEIPYDKNNEESVKEAEKSVKLLINQYYRFMSYKTFYRKVLGERIVEKKMIDDKIQKIYRKNDEGEYERDVAVDRIEALDNTVIIVDEAHNLTGVEHGLNNYGQAVKKIINKSKNIRVVLLSATPMKNFADDIVELINFIRPKEVPMLREKIFTNSKSSDMGFKPDGLDYFKKMASGYISYFRGADPFLFALKKEMGDIPPNLLFTPLVLCNMKDFQLTAYKEITKKFGSDALEKNSGSVSNFVLPILEDSKLTATYGNEGFNKLLRQLESNHVSLCNQINKTIFNGKYPNPQQLIRLNSTKTTFTGDILLLNNLEHFSSKMYYCLKNILESFSGKNGASTGFVYANLRTVGIDIFDEILVTNGFLHYKENGEYDIKENTIDYKYGLIYPEFRKKYPKDKFYPATFVKFTGADDEEEEEPDEKINILKNVFNDIMNKEGKTIKLVLGTKVMNEGITLKNIKDVHILDTHYNLGRVIQVIGRAVRYCVHYDLMSEKNPYPEVNVYKYVVNLPNQDSTEIVLYEKAEKKLMLIKKLERTMKEIAIDCPINYQANVFIEEQEKSKTCQAPLDLKNKKSKSNMCTDLCDFMPCKYTCADPKLTSLYDPTNLIYKRLEKEKLDYSTFLLKYATNEIEYAKNKIKELYKLKYVYTLSTITEYVKKSLNSDQAELFDDFFIYQALSNLLPVTDDEFNSFSDIIYDRYNVPGYLIYRNVYYIFQPLDQKDDVPLFYRTVFQRDLINDLSMSNYLKLFTLPQEEVVVLEKSNFDTSYYSTKEENSIVGIIDIKDNTEVFKIRKNISKEELNNIKKRGEGIISIKGSTCEDKEKPEILMYSKKLDVKGITKEDSRQKICNEIKNKLIELEKYNKDNITYLIIPNNHPTLEFPLNIHDRKDYIVKEVEEMNLKISVESSKNKYVLTVKSDNDKLRSLGFSKDGNSFIKVIE